MNLNNNQKYLFSFITALLISFFAEVYLTAVSCRLNINDFFPLFSFKKLIVLFILSFILFRILYDNELRQKVLDFIYKYRYYLSVLIIAVCVIFQIHGSSINELNLFGIKHNLIAGISRSMRSDEYLVNTMFAFSQYHNGFGYFSDIVRATPGVCSPSLNVVSKK
ncbi:hypothetical protein [uncultured Methanobrevibacter sp.]|uniref:DUF7657 domain-containing protein n=3 Tax=uncultured Methanobrevibacter sp. TaxID=253161 RepID=UPI0025CF050A|nr:hypothetical protein [uncultured Methanobrevibacter sp.]